MKNSAKLPKETLDHFVMVRIHARQPVDNKGLTSNRTNLYNHFVATFCTQQCNVLLCFAIWRDHNLRPIRHENRPYPAQVIGLDVKVGDRIFAPIVFQRQISQETPATPP
jgi:hypothetical protein